MSDPSSSSSSSSQPLHRETLYFAFGSNLHLAQMARRCPESRYIGIAHLQDYRFQINQRGYANILPSRGDHVEGLVYLLNSNDEATLDRYEGVPVAYQKHNLTLEVVPAAIDHVGRRAVEMAFILDGVLAMSHAASAANAKSVQEQQQHQHQQYTEALVYVSGDLIEDSEPRDEYIDRMNAGIRDARKLGVSQTYIDTCLRRYIPDRVASS